MTSNIVEEQLKAAPRVLVRSDSDDFIANWNPEPLVPEELKSREYPQHVVTSKPGRYITIDGEKCLNLGTHNYLGLAENQLLEKASIDATLKYGVGSCGPRAFYGTMDVHLKLEEELAKFLNVEETVLYSFGFSTIASAIPAYIKHSDLVFIDEYCNFSIQQGIKAARCRTITFKHNDSKDLEKKILEALNAKNSQAKSNSKKLKMFLIVEGIYAKTGKLCPLDELIEIKKRYKMRLFTDESCSFGVLGSTGRGITEHLNCNIDDIDMIMASLENAMCSFGGFCAGQAYVMDHQRLAGSGYCFSASLPPLQAQVALKSLDLIRENPSKIKSAQDLYAYANDKLNSSLSVLKNLSDELSPIKVLVLKRSLENAAYETLERQQDGQVLENICESILREEHMAITMASYLDDDELSRPIPSIRLSVNAHLTKKDIDRVVVVLENYSLKSI